MKNTWLRAKSFLQGHGFIAKLNVELFHGCWEKESFNLLNSSKIILYF